MSLEKNGPAKAECIAFEAAVKCIGPWRQAIPPTNPEAVGRFHRRHLTADGQSVLRQETKRAGALPRCFHVTSVDPAKA